MANEAMMCSRKSFTTSRGGKEREQAVHHHGTMASQRHSKRTTDLVSSLWPDLLAFVMNGFLWKAISTAPTT